MHGVGRECEVITTCMHACVRVWGMAAYAYIAIGHAPSGLRALTVWREGQPVGCIPAAQHKAVLRHEPLQS